MKKINLNNILVSNFILAVIYSLLGIAGLKLAIPPGHATAIFPAAGISFIALLFSGVRLLPGVWLGSVSINLWVALGNGDLSSTSFLIATVIALGSSLQAWVGAFLVGKVAKVDWQNLCQWTDIICFLFLAGPVACLISASWGSTSLLVFNVIPIEELKYHWINWWIGDVSGVILFAPLSLIILLRRQPLWGNRLIYIAIPVLIATFTIALVFLYVSHHEHTQTKYKPQKIGESIADNIESRVNAYQNAVHSVANFIRISPNIKYAEFDNFTQPLFSRYPNLYGLSWNPYISSADKEKFEIDLAEQLDLPNFRITQLDQHDQFIPAKNNAWYLPVAYISPLKNNSKAIGYNIASNPQRLEAINNAIKTGNASATPPLRLVQETSTGTSTSILLLVPIRHNSYAEGIHQTNTFSGFAVGVFRIEEMLQELINQHLPEGISVILEDKNAPDSNKLLYSSAKNTTSPIDEYLWKTDIPFSSRLWQLSIYATPAYIASHHSLSALKMLFVGLVLIGCLQVLLFLITGRNHSNIQKIKQQNIDLEKTEERWKFALEAARDGVWDWNIITNEVVFSTRYKEMLGYAEDEMGNHFDEWDKRIHPDDKEQVYADVKSNFEHKTSVYENEHRLLCKGSSYRWVLARGKVVAWSKDNKPLRMLGTHTDITDRKQAEQLLQKNEILFRNLFENAETSIWNEDLSEVINALEQLRQEGVTDLRQYLKDNYSSVIELVTKVRVFQVNKATLKLFAATGHDDMLHQIHNTFGPNSMQVFINELCAIWEGKKFFRSEAELISLDGRSITAIISFHIPDTAEGFKSVPVSIIDITDRKIAEEKLQLSAKVFSETHDGIIITDTKGIIIDVNPAFCDITGYSREEAINQNPDMLRSGVQSPEFYTQMWQTLQQIGYWQGEVWNRKKEGELYAELLSISSILDEHKNTLHYIGIFTDITHSKKQQESLEQMAHYDALTQLPNRVLLTDRFTQALAHSKRTASLLAVCFLDLDNFKPVNDTYGHETGDQLLVEVAERIKINIGDEDTVSRHGGDEFILLLGDIESLSQCEQTLTKIIDSLAQPYLINTQSLSVSASIGISLYPIDDSDFDTLMRHADLAMYQAKLAGRNQYYLFNTKQDKLLIQKNIKLQEIQKALINNELELYYQPKVNMGTGKVFGAEALIRWNHTEKGVISPINFLPIIEGTDLEIQVGNWVIDEALKQLDSWLEQGIELEISVNIPSFYLQSPAFIDGLKTALALYQKVNAHYLQLEILESSALGNLQSINSIIKTCINTLDVNIALDDFGTGYSSLTHLRNLSAQTIKIDQAFVRDVLDDPNDYAIIDGIIGLSNAFNREVIAEGVETTEHGLMLLVMGCNQAQGYGIARPMPPLEFKNWLTSYTPNQDWITCAHKARTKKENKIKLFRLTLTQWQKNLEVTLQSSTDSTEKWPILKRTECHCGVWIMRVKKEVLFEESWIEKLEKTHNAMHDIADILFKKYQDGEIESAREGLKELQIAVENMNSIVGQCE